MKSMISMNDKSIESCKEYISNKLKDIIIFIENKLREFEEKNLAIKTEIFKYNSIHEQKIIDTHNKMTEKAEKDKRKTTDSYTGGKSSGIAVENPEEDDWMKK